MKQRKDIASNLESINDNLSHVYPDSGSFGGEVSAGFCSNVLLAERHYEYLYEQYRLIENLVNLAPQDANCSYPFISNPNGTFTDQEFHKVLNTIHCIGEPLEPIDLRGAITLAGIYGRLFGDGFILLGINDGRDKTEPVDWANIKSLDGCLVRHKYEVGLDFYHNTVEYYPNQFTREEVELGNISGVKYHISRVLRFSGTERHGSNFMQDGFNLSLVNGVYDAHKRYIEISRQVSDMVSQHSAFVFSMKGLSVKANSQSVTQGLRRRMQNILEGVRYLGGVMVDKDTESAQYINRTYSGLKDILEHTQNWLISNTGMPRNKLFGSAASNSLSEASEGEKRQWGEYVDRYRKMQVIPAYDYLLKILKATKQLPDDIVITFKPFYIQTPLEQSDIDLKIEQRKKTEAEKLKLLIEAGIITSEEAREKLETTISQL